MVLAEEEFFAALHWLILVQMPAYGIVKEAFDKREEFHPCGEIMYMDRFAPWKGFIDDIEKECDLVGKLKFNLM